MRMPDEDIAPTYAYLVKALRERKIAYLHVIQPRISASDDTEVGANDSDDSLRALWGDLPYIAAGGFTRETAIARAEANKNELICFGRSFISNVCFSCEPDGLGSDFYP